VALAVQPAPVLQRGGLPRLDDYAAPRRRSIPASVELETIDAADDVLTTYRP
jgi:hypothetical protein